MARRRRLGGLLPSVATHLLLIAVAITMAGPHPRRPPDPAPEVTLMIDPLPRAALPPDAQPVPEPPPVIAPPPPPATTPTPHAATAPPSIPAVKDRARPAPNKPREPRRDAPPAPPPAVVEARPSAPAPIAEPAQPTPGWDNLIAAWLAAHRHYPDAARRDNAEGDVTVRFTVAPDGHVLSVAIVHGSGSDMLDDAARAMLDAANLPAPNVSRSVTVRIRYRLDQAD